MRVAPSKEEILSSVNFMDLDQFCQVDRDQLFARLREKLPISWHAVDGDIENGFWVLTTYKDVMQAWKNTTSLSSEHGIMLRLHGKKDPGAGKMMVVTDPPRHTRLRKLHMLALNNRTVQSFEERIRRYVCYLLDSVETLPVFDFTEDVAAKLPVGITCELLGVDFEDWGLIAHLSKTSAAAEDEEFSKNSTIQETITSTNNEIFSYFLQQIRRRKKNLSEDMISHLIKTKIEDDYLTEEEISLNCFSLLIGGNETTKYASVGGLYAFIQRQEEWTIFKENRNKYLSSAVEEILRWTTPVMHSMRIAKDDTHIGHHIISKGEVVTLWNNSANRDATVFHDPYTFDIRRTPNKHLAFGWGPHNCLGASVARLELAILFDEIAKRDYTFKIHEKPSLVRSNVMNGYKHLQVSIC